MGEQKTLRVVWTGEMVLERLRLAFGRTLDERCASAFGEGSAAHHAAMNVRVRGRWNFVGPDIQVNDTALEAMAAALNRGWAGDEPLPSCDRCGATNALVACPATDIYKCRVCGHEGIDVPARADPKPAPKADPYQRAIIDRLDRVTGRGHISKDLHEATELARCELEMQHGVKAVAERKIAHLEAALADARAPGEGS